jgi:5-formyltetrahydrofolate cyclo-ligase
MRGLLASLPVEEVGAETRRLTDFLTGWAADQGFQDVLATLPWQAEPDLTPFLRFWLGRGRVALARTGPGRSLDFGFVSDLDGPWEIQPSGLREPARGAPAWRPGPRTLVLVPGLAYAPAPGGGALRLGRGGGYYDRWLSDNAGTVFTLGVGLSVQTLATLPLEAHDQPLHAWWDGTSLRA